MIGIPEPNMSANPPQQLVRWKNFLKQWQKAGRTHETIVIGDTNLDHLRWDQPSQRCKYMVEETKMEVETEGFSQQIKGHTRSWPGAPDACLDQVWTNSPEIIISTSNKIRGASDHNPVGVVIRLKGGEGNNQEYLTRKMSNFDLDRYRESVKSCHWEELYEIQDLDKANQWVEEKLQIILQNECPLRVVQPSKKLKNWITPKTLKTFKKRDEAKELARQTRDETDWAKYKKLRNRATKEMREDKKNHYKNLYDRMDTQNNVKGLYNSVRTQLGAKQGGPPQALVIEGIKITAPEKMANEQMSFFDKKK